MFLQENPDIATELETKIRASLFDAPSEELSTEGASYEAKEGEEIRITESMEETVTNSI